MESDIVAPPPRQNQNTQQSPSQGQSIQAQNPATEVVGNEVKSDLHLGVNPQNMTTESQGSQAQPLQANVQNQEATPQAHNAQDEQSSHPETKVKKSRNTAVIVVAVLIFLILAGVAVYAGLIREPVT